MIFKGTETERHWFSIV